MEFFQEIISYQQIKEGYKLENDRYELGKYAFEPNIIDTFMSNPCLTDYSDCMIFFNRANGHVAGRQLFFPTKLKLDGEFFLAQSGSSLETEEEFRQYAIGMDIINYPIKNKKYPFILYAGIAKMAIPIYRALRFYQLSFPEYWQPRKSRFLFKKLKFPSWLIPLCSSIIDIGLSMVRFFISLFSNRDLSDFKVIEMGDVPKWVNDIIDSDNHKYSEYHDQEWMQWALKHNFFGKTNDTQHFFAIYKDNVPVGFFMTKERCMELPEHNIDEVVFGSVFEWGSIDEGCLDELMIYKMAFNTFSKKVDIVTIASPNKNIATKLKRQFMFPHGESLIIFKDFSKTYKDAGNIENWRIRVGYADVPFY